MNLAIYKPGQGTIVRIGSAVLFGLITIATAAWVFSQSGLLAEALPASKFQSTVEALPLADGGSATGARAGLPAPGSQVNIITAAAGTSPAINLGTATVVEALESQRLISFRDVKLVEGKTLQMATGLAPAAAPQQVTIIRPPTSLPAIEKNLLGLGLAVPVLLVGLIVGYWLIGLHHKTVEFLIATDFEMKKVHWSSLREIRGHTIAVIAACVVLGLFLFAIDFVFNRGFRLIDLLPR
jgi:preprotein translocase SecE subunit